MGFESTLSVVGRGFAIDLGARHLAESRPVGARGDGCDGAIEAGAMLVEEGASFRCLLSVLGS
jgi:hypothetical protein